MNNFVLIYYGGLNRDAFVPGLGAKNLTEADITASGKPIDEILAFRSGDWPIYVRAGETPRQLEPYVKPKPTADAGAAPAQVTEAEQGDAVAATGEVVAVLPTSPAQTRPSNAAVTALVAPAAAEETPAGDTEDIKRRRGRR